MADKDIEQLKNKTIADINKLSTQAAKDIKSAAESSTSAVKDQATKSTKELKATTTKSTEELKAVAVKSTEELKAVAVKSVETINKDTTKATTSIEKSSNEAKVSLKKASEDISADIELDRKLLKDNYTDARRDIVGVGKKTTRSIDSITTKIKRDLKKASEDIEEQTKEAAEGIKELADEAEKNLTEGLDKALTEVKKGVDGDAAEDKKTDRSTLNPDMLVSILNEVKLIRKLVEKRNLKDTPIKELTFFGKMKEKMFGKKKEKDGELKNIDSAEGEEGGGIFKKLLKGLSFVVTSAMSLIKTLVSGLIFTIKLLVSSIVTVLKVIIKSIGKLSKFLLNLFPKILPSITGALSRIGATVLRFLPAVTSILLPALVIAAAVMAFMQLADDFKKGRERQQRLRELEGKKNEGTLTEDESKERQGLLEIGVQTSQGAGMRQATMSFSTQKSVKEGAGFVAALDIIKAKMGTDRQSELTKQDVDWYNNYAKIFDSITGPERKNIADFVNKPLDQINVRDMALSDFKVTSKQDKKGKAEQLKDFEAKVLTEKDKLEPPKAENKPPPATPPLATPQAAAPQAEPSQKDNPSPPKAENKPQLATPQAAAPQAAAPQAAAQSESSKASTPSLVSLAPSSGQDITAGSQAVEQAQEKPPVNSFDTINADQQVTVSSPPTITTIPNIHGDRTKFRAFELFEPTIASMSVYD